MGDGLSGAARAKSRLRGRSVCCQTVCRNWRIRSRSLVLEAGIAAKVEARKRIGMELWEEHFKDPVAVLHQASKRVDATGDEVPLSWWLS